MSRCENCGHDLHDHAAVFDGSAFSTELGGMIGFGHHGPCEHIDYVESGFGGGVSLTVSCSCACFRQEEWPRVSDLLGLDVRREIERVAHSHPLNMKLAR